MQFETIIKNGHVVTAENTIAADIGIDKGKITAIGKGLEGSNVIDAAGKYILPGAIDVHTHWQLPFCGTVSADDFESGSKAGAVGGVTTFIDFAIQTKGKTLAETIAARRAEADAKVCIDYSLHAGITDWNERTAGEIKPVIEGGIPTFKMFMVYKSQGWQADDGILDAALKEASKYGGRIGVHAENNDIIERLTDEHVKKGLTACKYHSATRTNFTEIEAIGRAVRIAEEVGGRLYIFHMSTAGATLEVKKGRERG
ncbi:MAG: amidohydrolase family protein, partial [Deltaproteobacteria bacterium]|nr:amidohydrolase family protein [Deltaproteobacteria bacterium]